MAKTVLTDASITIGGVDLSDHIEQVAFSVDVDEPESTAFGGNGWRSKEPGLKEGSISLTFHQDFAASEVDATIWPLIGTKAAFVIKPTSGAVTATNPSYSGNVIVGTYSPLDGSIGDLSKTSATWGVDGAITRATS